MKIEIFFPKSTIKDNSIVRTAWEWMKARNLQYRGSRYQFVTGWYAIAEIV